MDWIVFPQNSYVEALPSNVLVISDGATGVGWDREGSVFMTGLVALYEKYGKDHSLSTLWGHSKA